MDHAEHGLCGGMHPADRCGWFNEQGIEGLRELVQITVIAEMGTQAWASQIRDRIHERFEAG